MPQQQFLPARMRCVHRQIRCVIALFISSLMLPAPLTQARPGDTDHPLISAYEGSVIRKKEVAEFDEYAAFIGMDESGKQPITLDLQGKITKILYLPPKNRSILEMFRNYQLALEQAGVEILYQCNQKKGECVARYAGPTFQKTSDIHSMSNLDGRYLLGKLEQDQQTAYIAVAVGVATTTIHVVEIKNMQTELVSLDADALGRGIDQKGYVVVPGVYFDTNEATILARSKPALEEMAKLLTSRAQLSVYVVGHTDSQGSFTHNRNLSQRRADAVVTVLVEEFAIGRQRLQGHGVGPLAPQATNATESGRLKNRRVVLVAQ